MGWLLLRLGLAIVDLDSVARQLAHHIVTLHGGAVGTLSASGTQQELKRLYGVLCLETGLPMAAQAKVAEMAWRYIVQAADLPPAHNAPKEFSFYA